MFPVRLKHRSHRSFCRVSAEFSVIYISFYEWLCCNYYYDYVGENCDEREIMVRLVSIFFIELHLLISFKHKRVELQNKSSVDSCVVCCFSSYLHCKWATLEELEKDPRIHQKIKRFRTKQAQMKHLFTEVTVTIVLTYCSGIISIRLCYLSKPLPVINNM